MADPEQATERVDVILDLATTDDELAYLQDLYGKHNSLGLDGVGDYVITFGKRALMTLAGVAVILLGVVLTILGFLGIGARATRAV